MALTFVGSARASGASSSLPSGAMAGDLIVVTAWRTANATAPTVPAGWTTIDTRNVIPAGVVAARIYDGGAMPNFTNATVCDATAWRGFDVASPSGGKANGGATSTTLTFPAITLVNANSTSHVVRATDDERPDVVIPTPAGHTNIIVNGASDRPSYACYRISNVASAGAVSVTVGRSSAYSAVSFEIKAAQTAPAAAPTPTFANITTTTLTVNWASAATDIERWTLQRAPEVGGAAGTFANIADLPFATKTFNDSGLTAGTTYYYRVIGVNGAGTRNGLSASQATTQPATIGLNPTSLNFTGTAV